MYKNIREIAKLQFPLYVIHSENWDEQDGILYLDGRILDDKNKKGSSIGIRRLQSGRPYKSLVPLKNPLFFIADLVKAKKHIFVSSCGTPFIYEKEKFQKIKCHLIKKFEYRGTFTFLWLHGLTVPIEIPRPPSDIQFISWARILYIGEHPWTLYEFSKAEIKNARIKV